MLKVKIPGIELWDEKNEVFIPTKDQVLLLEHSLVSLSKWEQKWEKPFLSKEPKTREEVIDYIRCMTITQNVPPIVYSAIPQSVFDEVSAYIERPMTATTFRKDNRPPSREIITAEVIYYWMIGFQIPAEYQKWHLNQLLTLIQVCNIKNTPPKKRSKREIMSQNRALNEARRAKFNTGG